MDRISRDTMFMRIVQVVAERSTCPRKHVGAVLVQDNRIVSIGYNGAPPGMPHCDEVGCGGKHPFIETGQPGEFPLGCTRTIHAELNAVAFAARHGAPTEGGTMYSTCATCANCAALLVSSGIARFVYNEEYRLKEGLELLEAAGIEVIKWTSLP